MLRFTGANRLCRPQEKRLGSLWSKASDKFIQLMTNKSHEKIVLRAEEKFENEATRSYSTNVTIASKSD